MVQYSLFVLKAPLNPKQTNKQTSRCVHFDSCPLLKLCHCGSGMCQC